MVKGKWFFVCMALSAMFCANVAAEEIEYLNATPLTDVVNARSGNVEASGKLLVPVITWGGDVSAIYTHSEGIFKENGLEVELFLENNFPKQVEAALSGKTPYIRGTMGMVNQAVEVFHREGQDLVVVYQLTWSSGGDVMVVRDNIKTPADLRGKTIALQYNGPHMDYLANVLKSAGVSLSEVKFRYLRELTLPTTDTAGKVVDSVSAFQNDPSIDAVMVISPDASLLTSGGKVGTGAEGSVKGARALLSTKTASKIIADVYAVRRDYFESHKDEVERFVRSLIRGQDKLREFLKNKNRDQSKYAQLTSRAAFLLLGSPQATADVEGLLGDCEFVDASGNEAFFTGKGTTRSFVNLIDEIQTSFTAMHLMSDRAILRSADWDFAALSGGSNTAKSEPSKPKFDQEKIEAEAANFSLDGTLFVKEIFFKPNQNDFVESEYAKDFAEALKTAETYEGAIVIIEGHADPEGIRRAKKRNENAAVIAQMEQQVKNLSLLRSREVLKSFMGYCKSHGYSLDESRFVAVGMGIKSPKYPEPVSKDQWLQNMRVAFRIKQIEAEMSEFTAEEK